VAALAITITLSMACAKSTTGGDGPTVEAACDPAVDLEHCDGQRRLTCDAVAKIWVEIEICEAPTQCTEIDLEDEGPAMATECAAEQGP
jgi:hypothetical protein